MGWIRSPWLWVALFVLVALTGGMAYWSHLDETSFRADLLLAERDLEAGRLASAHDRLRSLTARRAGDAETWYLLGLCEKARGKPAEALEAWNHAPAGSSYGTKSAIKRSQLLIDSGKFAEAEAILEALPRRDGQDAADVRKSLDMLYRFQGRTEDLRRLLLEPWEFGPDAPDLVLRHNYSLDISIYPSNLVESLTAHSGPDDDRVWLSLANLAIRNGKPEEASPLLAKCLERRPNDVAVWRTMLDASVVSGSATAAWRALQHLPASDYSTAQKLRLRAWFAARLGDEKLEEETLRAVVAEEPGDMVSLDRLVQISLAKGDSAEADRLRRRRAEVDGMRSRYAKLIDRKDRVTLAADLEKLATDLGRKIEARGWSLIRHGKVVKEPLLQRNPRATTTLAQEFADLGPRIASFSSARPLEAKSSTVIPFFVDDVERVGLSFSYDNGHTTRRPPPPEAMGGGVGILDYDGDGWLDVYVVQGGAYPPSRPPLANADRLFRNKGDGSFEDATARSAIAGFPGGYGHGVTVGDYDNDGKPDLFLTRWRSYALYRNKGDGTFEDVTERVGLGGDRDWPTSAAFADLDADGDLDLYVCHYLKYDETNPKRCQNAEDSTRHECNPLDFDALPDHAFRNDCGKFVDVTKEAGLFENSGRGLGVIAADLDGDNRVDLYVANDLSANYLYKNLGGFRFEEVGLATGAAASASGGYKAGMGVACGDLDADGLIDLAVTNYLNESTTFYKNFGQGLFVDHSEAIGMAAPTRLLLGFGLTFLDANNDGCLDVLSANGHVIDPRPKFPWMMPLQLLMGGPDGRLRDVSSKAGSPFGPLHLGRGLATGDLDNDGRLDALVICQNEPMVYLHNQTANEKDRHFVVFKLEGTKSNRDGIGATVTIQAGKRRCVVPRFGGGSYQSAEDLKLHVGLGGETKVDRVEVKWPSGQIDAHSDLKSDSVYLIREGDPQPKSIRGAVSAK